MLFNRGVVIDIFVLLFVVSIPWNWLLLYREKVAENRADMMRRSHVPEHCRPNHRAGSSATIIAWLRNSLVFHEDECKQYHKTYTIDPLLSVPPVEAFGRTLSGLALAPATALGKAMSEFNLQFLGRIPVSIWIPAMVTWFSVLLASVSCMHMCLTRRRRGGEQPPPYIIEYRRQRSSDERRRTRGWRRRTTKRITHA